MSKVLLSTRDLSFSYPDSSTLFFKDFEISEGSVICVTGPMGSGKTTFAKLLSGLEKPTSGKVLYKGEDIWVNRSSRRSFAGKAALLFQFSADQLFEKTVLADVMFGPLNMALDEKEAEKAAEEALRLAGVEEKLWRMDPFMLSGGQKKLVSLAGVLAIKPEVLILDEVTSALDSETEERVLSLLDSLRKEKNMAIVLITHDKEVLNRYASDGGIYEIGNDK